MEFSNKAETLAAMLVTAKWLPELVRRTEAGVKAMGLTIEKRLSARYEDGTVEPVLVLRGKHGRRSGSSRGSAGSDEPGWELELHLRNAFEDFLLQDREARPRRLDPRLFDERCAEEKLSDVIAGRLDIVRSIAASGSAREARRKIEKTARRFQWLRVWEHEA